MLVVYGTVVNYRSIWIAAIGLVMIFALSYWLGFEDGKSSEFKAMNRIFYQELKDKNDKL